MLLEPLSANQGVISHSKYIFSLDLQVHEGLFQRRNLVHSSVDYYGYLLLILEKHPKIV